MIWANRSVTNEDVESLQLLFLDQASTLDPGKQMLLVSCAEEWPNTHLWVAVPDIEMLEPYYGFALCQRGALPIAPSLVAGCPVRFGLVFHGH